MFSVQCAKKTKKTKKTTKKQQHKQTPTTTPKNKQQKRKTTTKKKIKTKKINKRTNKQLNKHILKQTNEHNAYWNLALKLSDVFGMRNSNFLSGYVPRRERDGGETIYVPVSTEGSGTPTTKPRTGFPVLGLWADHPPPPPPPPPTHTHDACKICIAANRKD